MVCIVFVCANIAKMEDNQNDSHVETKGKNQNLHVSSVKSEKNIILMNKHAHRWANQQMKNMNEHMSNQEQYSQLITLLQQSKHAE